MSFAGGATIPTLALLIPAPDARLYIVIAAVTLGLLGFGAIGAMLGGSSIFKGSGRVVIGGWLAMLATFGVGRAFGTDPA